MEFYRTGIITILGNEIKINKPILIIGVLYFLLLMIVVFFNTPNSKTLTDFNFIKDSIFLNKTKNSEVFTQKDISYLPYPVKRYMNYCGYIGTPKMLSMKASYKDVNFLFGKGKSPVTIDYLQYNSVNEPARIAYIHSLKHGIPFEGLDSYVAGKGSMKGILAKLFTLFNQTGETMDKASLVTFLSECLIIPNAALQDYISWEEIDDLHAKAAINYNGREADGIFTFNEKGEMISFTTNDREATETDGTTEKVKWSVVFGEYEETQGIKKPTKFQAIWHYDDGDLLYFDGQGVVLEYDTNE